MRPSVKRTNGRAGGLRSSRVSRPRRRRTPFGAGLTTPPPARPKVSRADRTGPGPDRAGAFGQSERRGRRPAPGRTPGGRRGRRPAPERKPSVKRTNGRAGTFRSSRVSRPRRRRTPFGAGLTTPPPARPKVSRADRIGPDRAGRPSVKRTAGSETRAERRPSVKRTAGSETRTERRPSVRRTAGSETRAGQRPSVRRTAGSETRAEQRRVNRSTAATSCRDSPCR